jgi:hypothetical protein
MNRNPDHNLVANSFFCSLISGEPFNDIGVLADHPKEHVFRFDNYAAELAGLVSAEKNHTPCTLRVPLEHASIF